MKNLSASDLQVLLNQVGAGDNKAVEKIYRFYQASLFAFIRLRVRDDHVAEEILNDTFMIAFQKPEQYNGSAEYSTWLCGIAKNVCGAWMRKQNAAMRRCVVDAKDDELENVPAPDWDLLAGLESEELREVMQECIDRLPVTHREAFFWTWFEEEPLSVVAARLDCPTGTVKSRLFNARAKIADCVRNVFGVGASYVG